jgi:hypothetical protein
MGGTAITRRRAKWTLGVIGVVFVLAGLLESTGTSREECAICRAPRVEYATFWRIPLRVHGDSAFAQWHRANRPAHRHDWRGLGSVSGWRLWGAERYVACSFDPLMRIHADSELRFVQTAPPAEVDRVLTAIESGIPRKEEDAAKAIRSGLERLEPSAR